MSYSIIYKMAAIRAKDTSGQDVTFLAILSGDSNIYDYNNRRTRSWSLLAAARSQTDFIAQIAPLLPAVKSGSIKIHGISVKRDGFFNLALAAYAKFVNQYKNAELLEDIVIPDGTWGEADALELQHAFRAHNWGDSEEIHAFTAAQILRALAVKDQGGHETMEAIAKWRNKPIEAMVDRGFLNLIAHIGVHGDEELFKAFFRYANFPRLEDEQGADYRALKWHALRKIKDASYASDIQNIFTAAPDTMVHADTELLEAIEASAALFRGEVDAEETMQLCRGGYKTLCADASSGRRARQEKERKNLSEQAEALLVMHANYIVEKSWYTNTGSIVKACIEEQIKPLQETSRAMGKSIILDATQTSALTDALYTITDRIIDHESGARYRKRSGHKKSAEQLKRAKKLLQVYLPAVA